MTENSDMGPMNQNIFTLSGDTKAAAILGVSIWEILAFFLWLLCIIKEYLNQFNSALIRKG